MNKFAQQLFDDARARLEAQMPQPITATVVQRPEFRNERIRDFNLWLQDNHSELEAYIASLEAALNDGIKEDPFTLMCVQHDIELLRVQQEQMAEAS